MPSDNLVARLWTTDWPGTRDLCAEAAAEIKRLRDEVGEYKDGLAYSEGLRETYRAERDRLQAAVAELEAALLNAEATANRQLCQCPVEHASVTHRPSCPIAIGLEIRAIRAAVEGGTDA